MPHNTERDAELQSVLNLLMPIRRQRLSRSERQQRQEEQQLIRIAEQQRHHQQQVEALRQASHTQRDEFVRETRGQRQTLEHLKKHLAAEQRLLSEIAAETQQVQATQQQHDNQRRQVDDARNTTRQCQKAVEKLEYLLTLPQEHV
ncbi:type III secretion protein [Pectobacterium zantedeschiae]|uniref:Type III secretion protein n=1 Tax=Pectobacterium zantedeschiae TaxID=2034769 RepID=A0A9X8P559_9GAMM|nr:type III secretion protein [Pectobacterium zantedeschiae]RYC44233.1 type III secretion protein [Pectobacterium zantedeschiae]RYC48545.1 type III secretion protein [Pectobacterium zantedeschiae]